jgi:serine/threonine protein kinase
MIRPDRDDATEGPEVERDPLELLVESFLERRRRGENPSIEEYLEGHPELAEEIRQLFPMLLVMEEVGALGEEVRLSGEESRIGRYEVHRRLEKGGMGVVYLGRDPHLGRPVVLKTVRADLASDPKALERLKREARIAGKLDHPGICPVLDFVEERGRQFVVMPLVEGEPLSSRLQRARSLASGQEEAGLFWIAAADQAPESGESHREPRSEGTGALGGRSSVSGRRGDPRGILRLVEKIARAVHVAHQAGVVHRDLKPGNIMIRSDGEPVILDFGLALEATGETHRLTQEGEVLGTPLYMAPEQVEGQVSGIGPWTDVYALGVILYELLTLTPPYAAPSRESLYHRILRGEPTPPRRVNPAISRDVEAVSLKAMAREPGARYPDALAFAEDLRRVRTLQPTVAKPPSSLGRVWRRVRRNPWASLALASLLLLSVSVPAFLGRLHSSRETLALYDRATRALLAISRGEPLRAEDLEALASLLPDEASRRSFLRDPGSREEWKKIEEALAALPRAAEEGTAAPRLVSPRGVIAELRPRFRFEVPEPAGQIWHYRLTLEATGEPDRSYPVIQSPIEKGVFAFDLPPPALKPGGSYRWRVRLDETLHGRYARLYQPEPASFQVRDPAAVREILKGLPPGAREPVVPLLRAAALNAHGFAEAALAELEGFPAEAIPEEKRFSAFLRAEALAILGDRGGFEGVEDGFRGQGASR